MAASSRAFRCLLCIVLTAPRGGQCPATDGAAEDLELAEGAGVPALIKSTEASIALP
jgi:hypothetical protein